jgi:hypothetical protein
MEVTTLAQSQTIAHHEEPRPLVGGRLGPLRGGLPDARYQAFLLLWIASPRRAALDGAAADTGRAPRPYAA